LLPFYNAYGKFLNDEKYTLRAIDLLESMPAENNVLVREFAAIGFSVAHAAASQGLIQLKKTACETKRCVSCGIGAQILQKNGSN